MSDERWSEVEASLRRQFEPPSLEALEQRIANAADERRQGAATDRVGAADASQAGQSWGRWVGLAVAVAATALLAWWIGGRSSTVPSLPLAPEPEPIAMTSRLAGDQLDSFLRSARALPPTDANCAAVEAPPSCDGTEPQPQLLPGLEGRVLGECGGATGVPCAEHDLPAQRAMVVKLEPGGAEAIVCIEPPWADPKPVLPEGSRYNIFRRELGTYVLYEVTPLPKPLALSYFSIP